MLGNDTAAVLGAAECVGIMEGDGMRLADGERVGCVMRGVVWGTGEGNAGTVYQALVNVLLLPHPAPADETAFPADVRVQVEQARCVFCASIFDSFSFLLPPSPSSSSVGIPLFSVLRLSTPSSLSYLPSALRLRPRSSSPHPHATPSIAPPPLLLPSSPFLLLPPPFILHPDPSSIVDLPSAARKGGLDGVEGCAVREVPSFPAGGCLGLRSRSHSRLGKWGWWWRWAPGTALPPGVTCTVASVVCAVLDDGRCARGDGSRPRRHPSNSLDFVNNSERVRNAICHMLSGMRSCNGEPRFSTTPTAHAYQHAQQQQHNAEYEYNGTYSADPQVQGIYAAEAYAYPGEEDQIVISPGMHAQDMGH
ncbi:hypothetical protein B0H11DRAFT_2430894 [Mycena galericulata]|nr:hypothetical protein B0H11DRAFT_2430894 [Mycena galericulata]